MKKLKFKIYIGTVSFLLALAALTAVLVLKKYDILPLKFFLPAIGIISVLTIALEFFMLKKRIKKKIKVVASVFAIILTIALSFVLFYLGKTFKFLNALKDNGYVIENYEVIVLDNDKYSSINELENKKLGYYKNETSQIEEALEKLKSVITTENVDYDNYDELVDKLLNEEVDSIIIEESYHGIIDETNEEFSKKTKVLYKIEVEKKSEVTVKNVNVKKETFNIYISGIDTYGRISSVSRSDVNIIATINPTTHQILLTTIPRDYYVQLDGTTGLKDKLTHAGIYGIDKSVKTIENLLDIEINYYMKVNFSSLENIVDALGGIDVYSEYTFTGSFGTSFKKGYNKLNGSQALDFARTRKAFAGGDRTRGQNQEAIIHGIINKACSKEILMRYTSLLDSLSGTFQTNMSIDQITDIIKKQIDEMASWNVTSISLDGTGASEYTYSYSGQKLYVMIPNEETILNAKQKIEAVSNNAILEASYAENTGNVNIPTKPAPVEEKKEEQVVEPPKEEKKEDPKPIEPSETEKPIEKPIEELVEPTEQPTEHLEEPQIEEPVNNEPTSNTENNEENTTTQEETE